MLPLSIEVAEITAKLVEPENCSSMQSVEHGNNRRQRRTTAQYVHCSAGWLDGWSSCPAVDFKLKRREIAGEATTTTPTVLVGSEDDPRTFSSKV